MKLPKLPHLEPWQYYTAIAGLGLAYLILRKGSPKSFSGTAEGYAPLESEAGCNPVAQSGVKQFRDFVLANYGGYDAGIIRDCGQGGDSGHKLGKSWDWGTDRNSSDPDALLDFLFANDNEALRRAGITYLIWQRRIWNTRARAWQNYTGADDHTTHIHFSFGTPGALGQTSFFHL